MKVLVTGGAGFIGSHIVEHFQGKADVVVLDNLRSGFRKNLDGFQCQFLEGSITDASAVKEAMRGIDYVFHLAAMISVPESMQKSKECVEINTQGTLTILEEAARAGVKKLCFSSSAAVYGDNPKLPKTEDMLPEPKSPYAVTKLDGEYYCQMFHHEGWLKTACMRYFNVFGPRQDPRSQYAAAVPIFIDKALRNEPVTVFGDGLQTRDFIYVKDVVAANVFLAEQSDLTGVYNVACGRSITINDLAETIITLTHSKSAVQYAQPRPGDIKHSKASVSKIQQYRYLPVVNLKEGLHETVRAYSRIKIR